MKKFYTTFVIGLIALLAPALASAYSITVNIDNPDVVSVTYNDTPYEHQAGDNVFEYDNNCHVAITVTDPAYSIKSVFNDTENYQLSSMQTNYHLYAYQYQDGNHYTITTFNLEEARSGQFTFKVDNPDKIDARLGGTYTKLDLTPGENTIKFIPGTENELTISPTNYNTPLYQVLKNGEPLTANYGSYTTMVEEGMAIEVVADFPEAPATVAFEYVNDCQGIVTSVKVNGNEVTDFAEGFSAMLGDQIEIYLNTTDFKFNSIQLNNGTPQYNYYGSYTTNLNQTENVIKIDAVRHGNFNFTLSLTDPSHVQVYNGQNYNGTLLTDLTAGDNTLEFSTRNNLLTIKAASGCFITAVTADGETVNANSSNEYQINTAAGMKVIVESGAINRDKTMVIYVDDLSAAKYGCNVTRADRSQIDLTSGYNTISFYDGDLPLQMSFHEPTVSKVYLNGEEYAPRYEGSSSFEFNGINDGDIVKVYLAAVPSTHTLSFTISGDVHVASAIHDRINPFEHTELLSVLTGTEVSIEPVESPEDLLATLDDNVLDAVDGKYTFAATADHQFELKVDPAGIKNVSVETTSDTDVYNLQGIRVATDGNTNGLPAGIYIKGGKKVVIR